PPWRGAASPRGGPGGSGWWRSCTARCAARRVPQRTRRCLARRPASSPGRRPRRRRRSRASGSSAPAAPAGAARSAPGTPRHLRPVPVRADRLSPSCAPSFPHHVALPPGIYTARGANWAARGRPVSRRRGVCITDRPNDPSAGSCRGSWERPWRLTMESSASAGRVASAVLDPRRWWVLALLCGAFFMVLLDGTITILALTEGYRSAFLACAVLAGIGLALALERDRLLLEARRARRARRQRLVPAAPA